jgi:NAD-dependent deacetylase
VLITQNVDGLHQLAGNEDVIELHGNINRNRCFREGVLVDSWAEDGEMPPRCPRCGGPLRPDVVWFGETLPSGALHDAVDAVQKCDVFFSVGTSGVVQPAASFAYEALAHGAAVVEVNTQSTPLTAHALYVLHGPAAQVLPALVSAGWPALR